MDREHAPRISTINYLAMRKWSAHAPPCQFLGECIIYCLRHIHFYLFQFPLLINSVKQITFQDLGSSSIAFDKNSIAMLDCQNTKAMV